MPGGNGAGSIGGGAVPGRGRGGNQGNRPGAGPSGKCMCPHCGVTSAHNRGTPCYRQKCPNCGAEMVRE